MDMFISSTYLNSAHYRRHKKSKKISETQQKNQSVKQCNNKEELTGDNKNNKIYIPKQQ